MRYAAVFFLCTVLVYSQSTRHVEGLRTNTPAVHALTNLTIVVAPGKRIEKGTVVIRDGIIQSAGATVSVPADARVWDCSGLTAYAGMIDLFSDYGQPKPRPAQPGQQSAPQSESPRGPNHWNANIRSDFSALENFLPEKEKAEKLRAAGFTALLSVPVQGLIKGSSVLVNAGEGAASDLVISQNVFSHAALQPSGTLDEYPNSLMGRIALLRQTFIDAQWYANAQKIYSKNKNQQRPEENKSLAQLENVVNGSQRMMFETTDEWNALRASAVAREFNIKPLFLGSGYEYRRLNEIKAINAPFIIPVNFPDPPDVNTPEVAMNAGYEELRHWDFASENPARMKKAGVVFALTAYQLKDPDQFRAMVKTAIDCGLKADDALAAVTTIPASIVGMEKQLGTIEPGKIANIILTDGNLFSGTSKIRETWIDGVRYKVQSLPETDIRGTWSFTAPGKIDSAMVEISGSTDKPSAQLQHGTKKVKFGALTVAQKLVNFSVAGDSIGMPGVIRFSGTISEKSMSGIVEYPDGSSGKWSSAFRTAFVEKPDSVKASVPDCAANELLFPDGAFGRKEIPKQQDLLIKNATIWTSGPQGILENSDMLISKGKITKIGKGLTAPSGVSIIDAAGKHVTAGLIDAHSHTAITGGVNESGQAITAEVRIADVINPDDVNIYRQLAGGITAINQLHGSANAIGGQNSVIKLRWGMTADEMKFDGAISGIKFALGENPKQSNWGDRNTTRYPQTRMGVEQIIRDEFIAAREYEQAMKAKPSANVIPPRRDLELETIVEIINGKRLVHSHCYRQDEILMLLRVSDDFGFTIGTLQHVLEGYKVADEIAKRNVGASLFSDWWAYKYEVVDAIPYAGKLMHDAGVLVTYNSDSNEMARRMNLEAAKAVKYGGVSKTDALNFVTLNAAKQLRIDKRVGSLEPGKDADFVIWSGDPLSTYSRCEQTWIDGRRYFDLQEDAAMNADINAKKAELIQKALKSKKKGSGPVPAMPQRSSTFSCHDEDHSEVLESEVEQ
ncbi:MAG: amidohydrolase family protein [Bacteroidota bacterium]